jgi:hypothetical protein
MLLVTVTTTPNKILTIQSLTALGTSVGGSAALTPLFNALGQAIKQHPAVKNAWLRWMLPLFGFVIATALVAGYIYLGYTLDPLTILGVYAMLVGAAFGADLVYGALKETPALPSGPNNHPADQAAALAVATPVAAPTPASIVPPPLPVTLPVQPSASTTLIPPPPPDSTQALPP